MWGKTCHCDATYKLMSAKEKIRELERKLLFEEGQRNYDANLYADWCGRLKQEIDKAVLAHTNREQELLDMLKKRTNRIIELEEELYG